MSGGDTTLWWLSLALGAVVIAVAALLLHRFSRAVHRIEIGAHAIWNAGTSVARNTAAGWMLSETVDRLDAAIDETAPTGDGRAATEEAP
jgi:hypothetical protein